MNTPTIDATQLGERLRKLPEPALKAARSVFTTKGYPKLTDEGWTPEALATLADELIAATEAAGHVALHVPVSTDSLTERVRNLPDDVADYAAVEARDAGIPPVTQADKWTLTDWREADSIIAHAEAIADRRRVKVLASLSGAGITSDDTRHAIVSAVTGRRTMSSRKLTGPEAKHVAAWCDLVSLGRVERTDFPEAYAPDWKAEAKALGVTQAELLKAAKTWAEERRLDKPKALKDVTDHRLIGALLFTADDGTSAIGEAAATVGAMVEESKDAPEPVEEPTDTPTEPVETPEPSLIEQARERMAIDARADANRDEEIRSAVAAVVAADAEIAAADAAVAKAVAEVAAATERQKAAREHLWKLAGLAPTFAALLNAGGLT